MPGTPFSRAALQADVEWLRSQTRRRLALKANQSETERLQGEIDHLRLYVAVLFRILIARKIVTPEDVRKLLVAIDAEDGQVDGAFPETRDVVTGQELPPDANPFADLDQ